MRFLFFLLPALLITGLVRPLQAQINLNERTDSLFRIDGEICFTFRVGDPGELRPLTRIISIDHFDGTMARAYANRDQFGKFLEKRIPFTVLPHPGTRIPRHELEPPATAASPGGGTVWNFYPTYEQYVGFMTGFAASYPSVCRLDTVGYSMQGRLLLALRISDNIGQEEAEPQFLYTSSIHGDETTGYILMLHLIDYLLTQYGNDPAITDLVNTTEICINPLANPDGTYHGGNSSVYGAVRYNANGIDINRNFPDPKVGQHPDGNPWQTETLAWMEYAGDNHFCMSANFHGGAEVFNYPWDTWSKLHADDDWWQFVGREWADTVHLYGPAGYFNDLENGITNGNAWYEINGGRQDYMNYWHHCREVTLEISNIKLLPVSQLLNFWEYNYRSFLNYIRQSHYGFSGIVTDTVTDLPVVARVFILGHDVDMSEVYSREATGFYCRPIHEGTYHVTFTAPGYFPKTVQGVTVANRTTTALDVQLRPLTYDAQDKSTRATLVFPNPTDGHFRLILPGEPIGSSCALQILNTMGAIVHTRGIDHLKDGGIVDIALPDLPSGLYFLHFNSGYRIYTDKLVIRR